MHMADALVSPAVAASVGVLSTAAAVYSIKKIREEDNPKKIPLMGTMSAFVFAAQMINFTIPGTGSSGHICGGVLLAALLRTLCSIYFNDWNFIAPMFIFCRWRTFSTWL